MKYKIDPLVSRRNQSKGSDERLIAGLVVYPALATAVFDFAPLEALVLARQVKIPCYRQLARLGRDSAEAANSQGAQLGRKCANSLGMAPPLESQLE